MTSLTIKQLRYVEAAGRTGSIAAAAADLNISQSSITAAIDALETDMGFDVYPCPCQGADDYFRRTAVPHADR